MCCYDEFVIFVEFRIVQQFMYCMCMVFIEKRDHLAKSKYKEIN